MLPSAISKSGNPAKLNFKKLSNLSGIDTLIFIVTLVTGLLLPGFLIILQQFNN